MKLNPKSPRRKILESIRKHASWHKKFAWTKTVVNERTHESVWLSYYLQKFDVLKIQVNGNVSFDNKQILPIDHKHADAENGFTCTTMQAYDMLHDFCIEGPDLASPDLDNTYETSDTVIDFFDDNEAGCVCIKNTGADSLQKLMESVKKCPDTDCSCFLFRAETTHPYKITNTGHPHIFLHFDTKEAATMFKLKYEGVE